MLTYFSTLQDIDHYTHQLQNVTCKHCKQSNHLLSHGYIHKKSVPSSPVGKRVFCSNRPPHSGCGRTHSLYLASFMPFLHYQGCIILAFFLAFIQGVTINKAYQSATGAYSSRNAYRWLHKVFARLSHLRSLFHQPISTQEIPKTSLRRSLLALTLHRLLHSLGEPLCLSYQLKFQHAFL